MTTVIVTGNTIVGVNPRWYRPVEVELPIGNPRKAKTELEWVAKTSLEELSRMMVEADLIRNAHTVSF
jgi:GDPmannose 4,6-dehydratase